jgi:hypothetical protein
VTDYTYSKVAVYAELGGQVRLARNSRSFATDPVTGVPIDVTQGAFTAPYLDTDSSGIADFTATTPGPIRLTTGATFVDVYSEQLPGDLLAAAASAAASAASAALSASLVGAPADTAVAAIVGNPASATRVSLDSMFVTGVFPEKYGAVGDGVTDDTTALASALAAGTVVLLDPAKTYLASVVSIPAGVTLRSKNGGKATLKAKAGITAAFVRVEGSNSGLINVIVDGNVANQTSTAAVGVWVNYAAGTVSGMTVRNNEIKNLFGDGMRVLGAHSDVTIEGNYIHDGNGQGITVQVTAPAVVNRLVIRGNRVRQVALTSAGCGIQVLSSPTVQFTNLTVHDNNVSDLGATGIPIEINWAQKFSITNNIVTGVGTRGISMGNLFDGVVSGNTIHDQSMYGIELNTLTRVAVVGNYINGCASGMSGTAGIDLLIEANQISNTLSTYATPHGIFLQTTIGKRITIQGNYFLDIATAGIKISTASEDVTVRNNTFIWSSTATTAGALIAVQVYGWQRGLVEGNVIHTALAGTGGTTVGLIHVGAGGSLDVRIRRNILRSTTGAVLAIGGIVVAGIAAAGLVIEDNEVVQLGSGVLTPTVTNDDVTVSGNKTLTCTTPENLKATHIRRTKVVYEATAAPTAGTWRVGDIVWNSTPAASGVPGWMCVTAGTPGTWKAMAALAP